MQEKGHPDAQSSKVPFPSLPSTWSSLSNDVGQDIFARFSIYLSLHPEKAGNAEFYNIADESQPRTYSERWPFVCSLFGLEGTAPVEISSPQSTTPERFLADHSEQIEFLKKEKGIDTQQVLLEQSSLESWATVFALNHEMVIAKAKATGFTEEMSYKQAWETVYRRYERAGKAYFGS